MNIMCAGVRCGAVRCGASIIVYSGGGGGGTGANDRGEEKGAWAAEVVDGI